MWSMLSLFNLLVKATAKGKIGLECRTQTRLDSTLQKLDRGGLCLPAEEAKTGQNPAPQTACPGSPLVPGAGRCRRVAELIALLCPFGL